jgi:hypothetical protein
VTWPSLPVRATDNFSLPTSFDLLSLDGVSGAARDVLTAATVAWVDEEQIRRFLADAPYMSTLKGLVQCNFTRIQTCSDRHSFFWSAVQTLAVVVVVAIVVKTLQLPYIEVLLFICAVPVFMYVTYGYSPSCAPLIPTCLLGDLFGLLDWLLPASVQWPDALVTRPGCAAVSCLRSCTDDPIVGFASYNDHAAWIMCEANREWAVDAALAMAVDNPIRMSVLRKCTDPNTLTAQRICFSITLVNSVPLILLGLLVLWLVPTVCSAALAGIQFLVSLAFTFVLFVHAGYE